MSGEDVSVHVDAREVQKYKVGFSTIKPELMERARFCVIVAAGDTSLHHAWFVAGRAFDLCVIYYGDDDAVGNRSGGV